MKKEGWGILDIRTDAKKWSQKGNAWENSKVQDYVLIAFDLKDLAQHIVGIK